MLFAGQVHWVMRGTLSLSVQNFHFQGAMVTLVRGATNDAGIHVARGLNWCCQIY